VGTEEMEESWERGDGGEWRENSVYRAPHNELFEDFEEVGAAYVIRSRKPHIIILRSHQVSVAVYQLTKLASWSDHSDIFERYIDCSGHELIKMDPDSLCLGLSTFSLDDVVHLQLQHQFIQDRNNRLACDKYNERTPRIIKPQFLGEHAVALCSLCDGMDGDTN